MNMTRLATLLFISLFIVSCGPAPDAGPALVESEGAETGKTVVADAWEVTLVAAPYMTKKVGSGPSAARSGEWGDIGEQVAEGIWLVIPIELGNSADEMRMLSGQFFKVRDGDGMEYAMAPRPVHASAIWNDERWGNRENQLPQNPIDIDTTRAGPIIFDIPAGASGLQLIMDGTQDFFMLGF